MLLLSELKSHLKRYNGICYLNISMCINHKPTQTCTQKHTHIHMEGKLPTFPYVNIVEAQVFIPGVLKPG